MAIDAAQVHTASAALIFPACLASLVLRKLCSQSWLCMQNSTAGQESGELKDWTSSHCKRSVWSKGNFAASESFGDWLAELTAFLTARVGLVREDEITYDVRATIACLLGTL